MAPPGSIEGNSSRKLAPPSHSGGSSTASLLPEGSTVGGGVSGSISPMSSNSSTSAPSFPGNIASLLQQVQQQTNPSQAASPPVINNALATGINTNTTLPPNDPQRAELVKAQLAVIGKMAMAQAAADQQKAAILAQSGLALPSAIQQAAALNSVLFSSSLAAQALAPFGGAQSQPLQVNPLAGLALPHTTLNPLVNTSANGGVFASSTAPQFPQLSSATLPGSIHKIPYRDASLIPDPHVSKTSKAEPFPTKIHRMLSELEAQGLQDIASFLPHGRAFIIHKPKQFTNAIMPRYFRMSRFSSFQRQLNLYDFKRITEGKDKGAYYHEMFLYGRPALTTQMKRTKIKGNAPFAGYHTESVDFYAMNPITKNPSPVEQGLEGEQVSHVVAEKGETEQQHAEPLEQKQQDSDFPSEHVAISG